jgi:hypothetical protein
MTIRVSSLERRSASQLRAFIGAQRLEVERHPDDVAQPGAAGKPFPSSPYKTYWRFLLHRASLEGTCVQYQTYDASGAENDWNIHIAPDDAHAWMLDDAVLYALSLTSDATAPIDLNEVKVKAGQRVIECELSPDDGLFDKFEAGGLPISEGSWWPNGVENEGQGPEQERVGVYGVFCGDYGHGGRPEIHPFDAFWRRFHLDGSADVISWDLGVFQDDSNRFNSDWSKAPVDVEFRVPFCIDIPVTLRSAVTRQVRFVLGGSQLCSVIGKNVIDTGQPNLTEAFAARTVRLTPNAENRVEVVVEDATRLPGRPFRLGFAGLTYTTSAPFGFLSQRAWVAGHIVIRLAIQQDGFAYVNFSGPNSTTAAEAADDDRIVIDDGGVASRRDDRQASVRPQRPKPAAVAVEDARAIVSRGPTPRIGAELIVATRDGDRAHGRRVVAVRPREPVLIVDEATGNATELESFDLFAATARAPATGAPSRVEADIAGSIAELAGIGQIGRRLVGSRARIEVDAIVALDLSARYAPFRDGQAQGEEESRLSATLNDANTGAVEYRCDVRYADATRTFRRSRVSTRESAAGATEPGRADVSLSGLEDGQRLVIGPLGETPTVVYVSGTATDEFGLTAPFSAIVPNYRVIEARAWVERATGTSLSVLRARRDEAERLKRIGPTPDAVMTSGLLGCLVDVLEALEGPDPAPATRVAGAVRLADRVRDLAPE